MADGIIDSLFATGDSASGDSIAENKRVLFKAVVVDVGMYNPAFEWSQRPLLNQEVSPETLSALSDAPKNSILARIITDAKGREDRQSIICYPFFPPHFCFPVKPGETVWVINEQVGSLSGNPYWICRIPEMMRVDDVNYTHADRKYHSQFRNIEQLEELFDDPQNPLSGIILPGFPNGGNTVKNYTLMQARNATNAYTSISNHAIASTAFNYEPVPRFSKRPGDTVLQGSNNTLICLGEDRGWRWYEQLRYESTNTYVTPEEIANNPYNGTIDIVAGRGRYPEIATTQNTFGSMPETTSPRLILNQRGKIEVDKYPDSNGFNIPGPKNMNAPGLVGVELEGDPDFVSDAARVYVSQNTPGDVAFGITQTVFTPEISEGDPVGYTPEQYKGSRMATTLTPSTRFHDEAGNSFVVNKADHIRLIARKQAGPSDINLSDDRGFDQRRIHPARHPADANIILGTIRLIKEGNKHTDLGLIAIRRDGSIQMSAPRIYLGRAPEDGGFQGEHNQGPGDESLADMDPPEDPGVTQPWVKYQQLEDLFNALFDDLKSFCATMDTHTTPGYGSPSPQIKTAVATLKSAIEDRRGEIERLKSKRIFGE